MSKTRLLCVVPFWAGDLPAVEKTVQLACDLLEQPTDRAELLFLARYDAPYPSCETYHKAIEKFSDVWFWRCQKVASGFPDGCNQVAYGLFQYMLDQRTMNASHNDIDTMLILEGDCVFTRRTWVEELCNEWDRAKAQGKSIVGAYQPNARWGQHIKEHINAVGLYDPEILLKLPALAGGPSNIGWDLHHGPSMIPVTLDSKLFKLDWQKRTITEKELFANPDVLVFHGVKDPSAINIIRERYQLDNKKKTLVSVHGYAGDAHQIEALMPMYEHHKTSVVIVTPEDSKIEKMGPHICIWAGKRAYIGQLSLDRQVEQMRKLLEFPFDFYLMNDSDSFVLTPELPDYLYEDPDVFYSNQVDDFRKPGQTWTDGTQTITWPTDYHAGHPIIAMQPPYFCSRSVLEKLVRFGKDIKACPITPFLDWFFVQCCVAAGVRHAPFRNGASCETVTAGGIAVMSECITKRGATFIHSVKNGEVMNRLVALHKQRQ